MLDPVPVLCTSSFTSGPSSLLWNLVARSCRHVDPDFLATWVCPMPDKSDRGTVSEEFPTCSF